MYFEIEYNPRNFKTSVIPVFMASDDLLARNEKSNEIIKSLVYTSTPGLSVAATSS
jgi:hypothetical protein